MAEETAISVGSIYQAIPQIEVNGVQSSMVQESLVAMDMRESTGGLSSLELRFFNTSGIDGQGVDLGFEYEGQDELALGSTIKIYTGDTNDPQEIFDGVISALEWIRETDQQPELVILAEDKLQLARLKRQTRQHAEGTVRQIVEAVAQELGLQVDISGLTEQVDAQLQHNETDLAFIRRLLERYDADLQIVGQSLHISPRSEVRRNEITIELDSQLLSCRVCADLAHQVNQVTYAGWDAGQGQTIHVTSNSNADLGPGTGRTGAEILDHVFGSRSEHLNHTAAQNNDEAQQLVNTCYSKRARSFVKASGKSLGNSNLRVGAHVILNGIGPRFENTYYVTETCHRFTTAGGYITEFEAESAFFGG